jgi:hypothetical protein
MPAALGSQWSKDPLRDRREDETAIDLEIADQLEIFATVLRTRRPIRAQLFARPQDTETESAPLLSQRSA